MVWGVGLCLLKSNFAFAENSTEIFGDPLEGTSVWIWNNTGLVREDRLGCFSSFGCSNLSSCVCSGKYGPGPVTGSKILVRALAGKNQSFPKLVSDLMCANDLKREVTISLSVASAASERHMVVPHQDGVPEVQRRAGGEGLRVRPRHHPHVLHPVLWHLHLLHVSEEVQDQPVLPHNCEPTCPSSSAPCLVEPWLRAACPFAFTQVRKLISDFAIILAILIFCGVDVLVGVETPKLIVPSEFKVGCS